MFWIVPVFSTGLQIVGATLSIAVIMINNTFFHYEHFIIFICSTNTSILFCAKIWGGGAMEMNTTAVLAVQELMVYKKT
jgi:hypothetical protein